MIRFPGTGEGRPSMPTPMPASWSAWDVGVELDASVQAEGLRKDRSVRKPLDHAMMDELPVRDLGELAEHAHVQLCLRRETCQRFHLQLVELRAAHEEKVGFE